VLEKFKAGVVVVRKKSRGPEIEPWGSPIITG